MITRTIGAVLRGRTTPAQVMVATVLGSLLGFGPGLTQGPALIVLLVALIVVLPANIGLTVVVYGVSSLAALLLAPVSFWVGRALLDGPAQGLFRAAVNAPVTGLFGLEYYTVAGGQVLGLLVGIAMGLLVVRSLSGIRQKLAGIEAGSDAYRKLTSNGPARVVAFLFLGSADAAGGWADLAVPRRGRPVRIAGIVVVALCAVGAVAAHRALTGPLLTHALRRGLELVNGATVDLESASLDLTEGRLSVTGLALADPNDLGRNVFSAASLVADVSGADLLRKRLRLDSVVISEAHQGGARASRGSRTGRPPEPPDAGEVEEQEKTLEDYVKTAEEWKQRLSQVRRWLDGLSGDDAGAEGGGKSGQGETAGGAGAGGAEAEPPPETLRQRLEREVNDKGWRQVTANHLIEGSPTFAVGQIVAEGVTSDALPGETLDVHIENLSTNPSLLPDAPHLSITSRSGALGVDLGLGGLSSQPASSRIDVAVRGIAVDRLAGDLDVGGHPPLAGGTLDFSLKGSWSGGRVGWVDLPLSVSLHDTTLTLGGKSQKVALFTLPLGIRGPIDDPRITIDDDHLVDALKDAGAAALQEKVAEEKQKVIDKATDTLEDKAKDALGGLLDKPTKKKKKKP